MIPSVIVMSSIFYALAGVISGLVAGILGIGGGIVIVPALLFIFSYSPIIPFDLMMQIASGTSLAIMTFTSLASIRAHYRQTDILWDVYKRMVPGLFIGTVAGALLADDMPTIWLKWLLSAFLLFVACKMFFDKKQKETRVFPQWLYVLVSTVIGMLSGLLGIGGGTLMILFLSYCGITMRKTAAVSSLVTLTVAIIGTIVFVITGLNEPNLPAYATGYIYWPAVVAVGIPSALMAPLGARLTYILPVKQLKYVFIVTLVATSIDLLF